MSLKNSHQDLSKDRVQLLAQSLSKQGQNRKEKTKSQHTKVPERRNTMWLVRRENNVQELPQMFGRFFDDFWGRDWPALRNLEEDSVVWAPRLDVEETEDSYLVQADLPGIDKKDLKVSLNDNVLTIKGERKYEKEEKSKNVFRAERSYGNFQRAITLPDKVKANEIRADYKDGVLKITLPKAEEVKPKQIEIQ